MRRSSRNRLTHKSIPAFPTDTLFDTLARVVAAAECLPRKELFESWAVAKRVRRRKRLRSRRVVELAAGHGLFSFMLLLLDAEVQDAVCIDRRRPQSFGKLQLALAERWPRLGAQVRYEEGQLELARIDADTLVVSIHGCGRVTDRALDMAIAARAPVAVLPCCRSVQHSDTGGLSGWLDDQLAIDVTRAARLRAAGYHIHTQTIPADITHENRLLLGEPLEGHPEP